MRKSRHQVTLLLSAALIMPPGGALVAHEAGHITKINIKPLPLGQALNELARQAGVQMSFPPALVTGKNAPALQGNLGLEEALKQLLSGSNLEAKINAGQVTVQVATSNAPTLDEILVHDKPEDAASPIRGYIARRSATATKTDTPILETPQSITVIGAQEMDTRRTDDVNQALSYSAGVHRSEGADLTSDSFIVRGFPAGAHESSLVLDGLKYKVQAYNGRMEPYAMERLELLRGAASVLHGSAGPGGVLNAVSKRPSTELIREVRAEFGNYRRKQLSTDFGGKLTEDGVLTYRLTSVLRNSDTFVDFVPDNRRFIAPSLKWQPNATTSLTLLGHYLKDRSVYLYGLPVEGTVAPNLNGRIPRHRFVGEPGYDQFRHDVQAFGYQFEHNFNPNLKLRHSLRYFRNKGQVDSIWVDGFMDESNQRATLRGATPRTDRENSFAVDTSLQYEWMSGPIRHTSLLGIDSLLQRQAGRQYIQEVDSLDLFSPRYGNLPSAPEPDLNYSPNFKTERLGLYVQDQMKLGKRWALLLGGRYERVIHSEWHAFTGIRSADREKTNALTGRAGLVYMAKGWAPFFSFSQSFEPQSGTDRAGARFKPTRGEQWEAGIRYQPASGSSLLSAAVYDLRKTNNLVQDPVSRDHSVQLGKVRSRGIELEARARIAKHINLIAAYAYTDAHTIESSPLTPEAVGKRAGGVPRHQVSFWADYRFTAWALPDIQLGGGMRHVDKTTGMWIDAEVPAYTVVDFMLAFEQGPWRLALNVNNLMDKTYIASCTYGCFYGDARKIIASVTRRW